MQMRPQPLLDLNDRQFASPTAQLGSHLESIIENPMSQTPLFLSANQSSSEAE